VVVGKKKEMHNSMNLTISNQKKKKSFIPEGCKNCINRVKKGTKSSKEFVANIRTQ